jgi:heme-degrading monooxygenase HmoA
MSNAQTGHVILWEFRVRPGCEADFEAAYGPTGAWAKLFAKGDGYLGTELLRHASTPRRYITIDRWVNAESHARFRHAHDAEFVALDAKCELLTESETLLDSWRTVRQPG